MHIVVIFGLVIFLGGLDVIRSLISGYVFSYITKIRVGIQSQVTFLSSDNNYSNCNCGGNHLNRTVKDWSFHLKLFFPTEF